MLIEENNRKIKGATAHDADMDQTKTWSERSSSLDYNACPDDFKKFIENTNLEDLVYWKLKEKLEKQAAHKQNEILKGVIADVERPLFAIVLGKTNGNQSKAAELLGCNRNTLHRKLKEFLINPRDIRKTMKKRSLKKDFFAKGTSASAGLNFHSPLE
ncbi:MAG: helix-turn-helix domain-containing protein [Bdellovibrionota bacterium]